MEGGARAFAEQRIGLMQIEWSVDEVKTTLGEGRERVGELLAAAGYKLHRPDWNGRLKYEGPNPKPAHLDVFAAPRILSS